MVENRCTTQGVQVAIGIKAQIMGPMVPVGQLLAGIAQGLEVTDGVWVLERGQRWDSSSSIHSASFDTASSCRVDLDSLVLLVAMTVQKAAQSPGQLVLVSLGLEHMSIDLRSPSIVNRPKPVPSGINRSRFKHREPFHAI